MNDEHDNQDRISLNIEDYNPDELLGLLGLPELGRITASHMKEARKKVLLTHPDKSQLDAAYFRFFVKVYDHVERLVGFLDRSSCTRSKYLDNYRKIEKEIETSCGSLNSDILKKHGYLSESGNIGTKWSSFKKEFDKWFDENGELSASSASGHEEFMKNTDDLLPEGASQEDARHFMEQRRTELGALVLHGSIQGLDSWNCFNGGGSLGCYGEDLRKAYTETVVPVSEEDFIHKEKYGSVDALKRARARALDDLDYEEGRRDNRAREDEEMKQDIARYYDQLSLMEKNKKSVAEFQKKLLMLRDK